MSEVDTTAIALRAGPRSCIPGPRSVATGPFMLCRQTLTAETRDRVELIDLTDQVREFVRGLSIQEGLISVCSQHTTCAVFVTENQTALKADIVRLLEALAPRSAGWLHNDPVHSDCDRRNGDSHLRAILLGQGVTLQIHESEVALGEWQRVLLGELDGPRTRTVFIQASGLQWNGLELLAAPRVFRGGEVGSPPLTERGRSAAPGRGGEVNSPPLTERGRSAAPGRGGEVGSPPLTERGRSATPGRGGEVNSSPLTERGRSATPGGVR